MFRNTHLSFSSGIFSPLAFASAILSAKKPSGNALLAPTEPVVAADNLVRSAEGADEEATAASVACLCSIMDEEGNIFKTINGQLIRICLS